MAWALPNLLKSKNFRDYPEFDDHEMLIAVSDEISGLSGYIGIHNTNLGPALGGTRLQNYSSDEQAMRDALNLSKAMTYKCALAGLPYGGGKGVIFLKENIEINKSELLAAYARIVESLRGLFKTGTDVGISDGDVRHMGAYTSHMLGLADGDRGELSTSSCAALGVFYTMQAALDLMDGSQSLENKNVAIKGVGKLGGELARLVSEAGGRVVFADVNEENVRLLQERVQNVKQVDVSEISEQHVDIYAPCALGAEFDEKTIKNLRCRAVVGGANNQLVNQAAGTALHQKRILYAPDYIANSGGLIYVADELEPGGFSQKRVLKRVENIRVTMADVFKRSSNEGVPTSIIADKIAQERLQLAEI